MLGLVVVVVVGLCRRVVVVVAGAVQLDALARIDEHAVEARRLERVVEPALEAAAVDDEASALASASSCPADGSKPCALWPGVSSWVTLADEPTSSRVKSPTWVVVATIAGPSAELPDAPGLAQPASASAAAATVPPMSSRDDLVARGGRRLLMLRTYAY